MLAISQIENLISHTKKYLGYLSKFNQFSQKRIFDDIFLRGSLERYLYLVCQSTLDLGEAYINYRKFRKPTVNKDVFEILHENGIINAELKEKLCLMSGFRNIIEHDYVKIDQDKAYDVLTHGLADIKDFIKAIENKLKVHKVYKVKK